MQRHAKRATIAVLLGAICSTVALLVATTGSASATVVLGLPAFAASRERTDGRDVIMRDPLGPP